MEKVFILSKLKETISSEEFRQWSVSVDQRTTSFQPGVLRYGVWQVEGWAREDEGPPPYDIVQEFEVDSWKGLERLFHDNDQVRQVRDEFQGFLDERVPQIVIYGDKFK